MSIQTLTNSLYMVLSFDDDRYAKVTVMTQAYIVGEHESGTYHCYNNSGKALFARVTGVTRVREVTIPAKVQADGSEYVVSTIGEGAFYGTNGVGKNSVKFAEGSEVTAFQYGAFQCKSLKQLEIPEQLRFIHAGAFSGTPTLTTVTVHKNNSDFRVDDDGCLYTSDMSKLIFVPRNKAGQFHLSSHVKEICGCALENCQKITEICFDGEPSVTSIGERAFAGTGITNFAVPPTVTKIGAAAFMKCVALEKISFGQNCMLDEFSNSLFEGCSLIRSLQVPKHVKVLRSRCFAKMTDLANYESPSRTGFEHLTFEKGSQLKVIQANVFYCLPLKDVQIPDTLIELDEANFFGCDNIEKFDISSSHERFSWTSAGVLMSANGDTIHYVKRSAKQCEISDTVRVISDNAFHRCKQLNIVRLTSDKSKLTKIGQFAFAHTAIVRFVVPRSLKIIGHHAFAGCTSLTEVFFKDPDRSNLNTIESRAFEAAGVKNLDLPKHLQTIGPFAFAHSQIVNVKWPMNILKITRGAFSGCKKLIKILLVAQTDVIVEQGALDQIAESAEILCARDVKVTFRDSQDEVPVSTYDEVPDIFKEENKLAKPVEPRVDFEELVLDENEWAEEQELGVGGFGKVVLARNQKTNEVAAVKHIQGLQDSRLLFKEAKVLARLVHPAICGIVGITFPSEEKDAGIYLEYCSNSSLSKMIYDNQARLENLDETALAKITAGICYGLRYVHAMGVIHRDVKPGNVLLNDKFEPKIADFGSATVSTASITMTMTMTMTQAGIQGMTRKYIAPEVLQNQLTHKADVFAFAVSMYELLTGNPYENDKVFAGIPAAHIGQVDPWRRPDLDQALPRVPNVVRQMIDNCWAPFEARWDFDDVIKAMSDIGWQVTEQEPDRQAVDDYIETILEFERRYPPSSDVTIV